MTAGRGNRGRLPDSGATLDMERFVEAYMGEANGVGTTAIRLVRPDLVGNASAAAKLARKYLGDQRIRRMIRERVESDPLTATRIERLHFLTRVLRGEEQDVRMGADGIVNHEPTLKDRMAAADAIAKALGEHLKPLSTDDDNPLAGVSVADLLAALKQLADLKRGDVQSEEPEVDGDASEDGE